MDNLLAARPDVNWRQHQRKVLYAPISLLSGRARFSARLIDASNGGVRIETRTARVIGEIYSIEVHPDLMRFRARILWDYYLDDKFVSGAELVFADESEAAAWRSWLESAPEMQGEEEARTGYEQRLFARRATNRPILFRDRSCWVKGSFRDISEGGSGAQFVVHCEHPPPPISKFKVQIDNQMVTFRAQTVWTRMVNGAYLLGLRGIEPDETPSAGSDTPPPPARRVSMAARETTVDGELPSTAPPEAGLPLGAGGSRGEAPPPSARATPGEPPAKPARQRISIELPSRNDPPAAEPGP